MLWVTASNQLTINPKDGKVLSQGSRPVTIIVPSRTCTLPVSRAAYQVETLVKHKSWKMMMDVGRNPREGIFPSLGLIVSWLLAVTNIITFHVFISTASREFIVIRGYTITHILIK